MPFLTHGFHIDYAVDDFITRKLGLGALLVNSCLSVSYQVYGSRRQQKLVEGNINEVRITLSKFMTSHHRCFQ